MPKHALEVHMLSVGDADSILVTWWDNDTPERLLVDGGEASTVHEVKAELRKLGAMHLDYVLCTHLDDDHAAGLVDIVEDEDFEIGRGYMHVVEWHVQLAEVEHCVKEAHIKEARLITASVRTNNRLLEAFHGRGIEPIEPFEGVRVGNLLVCGPSEAYYEELVRGFTNLDQLREADRLLAEARGEKQAAARQELKRNPKETAANSSSVLLVGGFDERRLFFTADGGVESQRRAIKYATSRGLSLEQLDWMQIPHHGSLNAINADLIDFYRPRVAYVSADGVGHPKVAVVERFKNHGKVYATFHPSPGCIRYKIGDAPERPGYKPAEPL